MAFFPFFMDIQDKDALVVGGGEVALRKIEKLKPFGVKLTVISKEFCEKIKNDKDLFLIESNYESGDEENFLFVIAATNDKDVNKKISENCKEKGIPVNVVDDPSLCTFLFPCLIKEGKLTIGISTSGSSPTACIEIKDRIRDMIPSSFDQILDYLYEKREKIKKDVKSEKERHLILKKLFSQCIEKGGPLTIEEEKDTDGEMCE